MKDETEKWVRPDLPPMPKRISKLPVDHRGFPVPWFVAWIDGKPDFRITAPGKIAVAYNNKLCWICGQPRGKFVAFVIGPMCAINRISAEPPSHRECAEFAAKACPFLTRPQCERREGNMPEGLGLHAAPGIALARNPGVALVWITQSFHPIGVQNGVLFSVGEPVELFWFAEGRKATAWEILDSIESGVPLLEKYAQEEGLEASADLANKVQVALRLAYQTVEDSHVKTHSA